MTYKKYYRVEKWILREEDDGSIYEEFRRGQTFDTLEEAKKYFDNVSSLYKVRFYEVEDNLLEEKEPHEEIWDHEDKAQIRATLESIGDKFTDEEWEKFLEKIEEECGLTNT